MLDRLSSSVRYDHPFFRSNQIGVRWLDESAGFEFVKRPSGKHTLFALQLDVQPRLELSALPRPTDQVGPVQRLRRRILRGSQDGRLEIMQAHPLNHGHLEPRGRPTLGRSMRV